MPDSGPWTLVEEAGWTANVFEPSGPPIERAMIFLHGHSRRTLVENAAWTDAATRHGLLLVCPHGGSGWWIEAGGGEQLAGRSPLEFIRESVLDLVDHRWGVSSPRVGLAGVSLGGQAALSLAYRYPRCFPVVAAVAPVVDWHRWHGQGLPLDDHFPDAETARQHSITLQLNPLSWPRHQLLVCDPEDELCYEGVERLAGKLASSGVPFESDFETRGGGHCWAYFDAVAADVVAFVAGKLEGE